MLIPGTVVIVTGGARGLGSAFCSALLERHAKVCFGDINEAAGRKAEQTFRQKYGEDSVVFVKCDVTKDSDIRNLFSVALSKFKRLDLMVNNAGIMNESTWERMIHINLVGAIRGTQLAIEHMRKDRGGSGGLIINVASVGGLYPTFYIPAYIGTKYGVVGFTRSWADNPIVQRQYGVKLALLCPGSSRTDILIDFEPDEDPRLVTYSENKEEIKKTVFLTGVLEPTDVADAFIKLVEREDNNGAVVTIQKTIGMKYRYTRHPHKL